MKLISPSQQREYFITFFLKTVTYFLETFVIPCTRVSHVTSLQYIKSNMEQKYIHTHICLFEKHLLPHLM